MKIRGEEHEFTSAHGESIHQCPSTLAIMLHYRDLELTDLDARPYECPSGIKGPSDKKWVEELCISMGTKNIWMPFDHEDFARWKDKEETKGDGSVDND